MFTARKVIPALCLAVSMSGPAVYAATTTPAAEGPGYGGHHRGHHHGFMGFVFVIVILKLAALHRLRIAIPFT